MMKEIIDSYGENVIIGFFCVILAAVVVVSLPITLPMYVIGRCLRALGW